MLSQLVRLISTFIVVAVLARLLEPSDFGLMAMVAVFSNAFILINDLGLPSAIIQKKDVTEEHLSSAFWANLLEGLVVTIVFIGLAPVIARFYSNDALVSIVMVLSVVFIIASVGIIQRSLYSKEMDFRTIAIAEITASVLSGIIAVVFAICGFGVWSLVAHTLSTALILAVMFFFLSHWKPKLIFHWESLKELLAYGLHLLGFNLVNYFSRNLDKLLIGKYLGEVQLGYYDIAYRLLLFPLSNISQVIGRVMFPALSLIQDNKEATRSAYTRATRFIATISFPLMAGVAILAPQLVRVAMGAKWERSIFLIQVLALVGLVQSIMTTLGWIYLSQGKTKTLFKYGIGIMVVYTVSFIIGLKWNVEGVAVAYAIAVLLLIYPSFAIPFRFIDMPFWRFARQFLTISLATGLMALVIYILGIVLEKVFHIGDLLVLITGGIAGALSYLGILYLIDNELLKDIVEVVKDIGSSQESVGT